MAAKTKPQVVIDSNVWISGLVFGGNPEKILRLFIEGQIIVVCAEELLSELRRKITQRFPLFLPNLSLLEASIREDALFISLGTVQITASRYVEDNKFIETALTGQVSFIVSGDKDLTDIGSFQSINILKPKEFLELFNKHQSE